MNLNEFPCDKEEYSLHHGIEQKQATYAYASMPGQAHNVISICIHKIVTWHMQRLELVHWKTEVSTNCPLLPANTATFS